ncbi:MAG: alpha/beta fold hydrolase [Phycisphaerae bacterium]
MKPRPPTFANKQLDDSDPDGHAQPAMPVQLDTLRHHDAYKAHARWWLPERPRGAVLYLHGIQSHGGWYEGSAAALAQAGLAVLMPDRRGCGLNRVQRGHAESPRQMLSDVDDLVRAVCERSGCDRAHLVGVSWGGKLIAAAAANGAERIASLTLIVPGIYPRVDLPFSEKMRVAWSLVSEPLRRFSIPLDDARLFTSNPERIAFVEQDAHRLKQVTGAFLLASRRLDRKARELRASPWRGPVHLLLAEHDRIIENDRTRDWFARLPEGDHRKMEYAGAHHTLEFEPDPEPMRRDVCEWILSRESDR